MKFTDADIRTMTTDKRIQDILEGDGFGIRLYQTGTKVFFYSYSFDGKKRFLNLGKYDPKFKTADGSGKQIGSLAYHRQKYEEAKHKRNQGIDPLLEKETAKTERKRTPFVADFVDEYIKDCKPRMKSWKEVERTLKVEIVPRWGKRKITDITGRDIILVRDEIKERGAAVMANRVLTYISMMFSYALDKRMIKTSPYSHIRKATKEVARERNLAASEIKTLWDALDGDTLQMSLNTKNVLKLILLTAQRPGEVAGMHSKEIDGHWWTLPGSRTKNKKINRVYLTDTALDLIGDTNGRGYIFETDKAAVDGAATTGSISVNALSFAIRRNIKGQSAQTDKVKRRKGEEYKRGPYNSKPLPEDPNRIGLEMFSPHDLRRTAATLMASEKVPYEVREKVLNHTISKLDSVYQQYDFDDEKIMAMQTLERKINSILTDTEGKVVSIQTGRKAVNQ